MNVIVNRFTEDRFAEIVLNRPERRNAISTGLVTDYLAALEELRTDESVRCIITRGAGPSFCSGLDLKELLPELNRTEPFSDWDVPNPAHRFFEAVRLFPKITIAQVHGFCVGGGLALMNAHDVAIAARSAQIGMPEILRGSFGQLATSTLMHAGIPFKKAVMIQVSGHNLSGEQADVAGLVSMAVGDDEIESTTRTLAREIATRHPAALAHAKIAVQMGREMSLPMAMKLDELVGARMRYSVNPTEDMEGYLGSQKGGTNVGFRR